MATLTALLKEALFDEKRIVTYMYLSRRGNVSCVEATKAMKVLYDERKDDGHLNAVYSLIGQLNANGSRARRVMLVREDKLEKAKSTFEKVISCDIYSLQTSVIRNLNILYGIDKADEDEYADQDAANSMVRCTQLAEEGRRARSITPLLFSSSDDEPVVAPVKVVKQMSETKAPTPIRPPVAKQSSLSAAFAKNKPLPPPEKAADIDDTKSQKPSAAKAPPVRSEKRPTASPVKVEAPQAKKIKNEAKKKRRVCIDSDSDEDGEKSNEQNDESMAGAKKGSSSQDSMKDMFSSGSMKDMFSSSDSPKDMFSSTSSPERDRSPTPPAKPPLRRSPRKSVSKKAIESDDDDFVSRSPKKVVRQQHVPETFKDAQGFLVTKEVTKTVVVDAPNETHQKPKEQEKALRTVQEPPKKRSGKQAAPSQTKISNFFGKK